MGQAIHMPAGEPPGREWEAVESDAHTVIAVGALHDVRVAAAQYEDACWAAGMPPARTYVRPHARRRRLA